MKFVQWPKCEGVSFSREWKHSWHDILTIFENILKNAVNNLYDGASASSRSTSAGTVCPNAINCFLSQQTKGACSLRFQLGAGARASRASGESYIGQALKMADSGTDEDLRAELAKLRAELIRERQRRAAAEQQVIELRRESTRTQVLVEEEEEAITNRLMKRLSELKLEKEQIARASESDSEYVTNSLTQRLEELKKQKHDVIAAAEAENEFIVNRLNKELEALRVEKNELEKKVQRLSRSNTPGGGTPGSSPALSLSSGGGLSRAGSYRLPRASLTDSQDRLAQLSPGPSQE